MALHNLIGMIDMLNDQECPVHKECSIYDASLTTAAWVYGATVFIFLLAAIYLCYKRGNSIAIVLLFTYTLATVIKTLIFTGVTSGDIGT